MVVFSRAVVSVGLALAGVACLIGSPIVAQDPSVKKASGTGAAAKPTAPAPAIFGTIDIEAVFNAYDKVKSQKEEFKAAAVVKHNELLKIKTDAEQIGAALQKLNPSSIDAKKYQDQLTELSAKLEAGRASAEREFTARETEMLATLYKEVQAMVARVAEYKGMTYVVQVSNAPIAGSDPNSVMAAMARTVVYADNRNDITKDVVFNLNRNYKAAGGVVPKATSAPGAAPAGK